ncbi:MAG TPA: cob(I)yrinic acid a,c-diamide adenosyltransferase [Bryocella sp.]|nr:cob(I)yrinic acid a,c-diamide adenosyltransferase [Bryocella sp.]
MGKIYTRKGDLGTSSLFSGEKVSKADIRLEAYGALDELQAQLGMARALTRSEELPSILADIQQDISAACSELASNSEVRARLSRRVGPDDTKRLEACIDSFTARFPLPQRFIIPGRTTDSAALHVARTVCRRAERKIVVVNRDLGGYDEILVYFNRLSDLLFTLAWSCEMMAVVDDIVCEVVKSGR